MLENILEQFGSGGTGIPNLGKVLRELQGLKFSLLTGATATTKINLAEIRPEDTILFALKNAAGTLTDLTSEAAISTVKASGTITIGSVEADDTVVVRGKTYVAKAAVSDPLHFKIGDDADATAANLAKAINAAEAVPVNSNPAHPLIVATAASNVVTVTAWSEGTAANAYTLVGSDHITVSGSGTLAGGTTTGGVYTTTTTTASAQLLLVWFDKNP